MNDRRPTEPELAAALRAHLPAAATADLPDGIHLAAATVPQQQALPSVLGALTDADPIGRQRALLIAAALLVAAALATAAVVGALNDRERNRPPLGGQGPLAFLRQNDLYLANPDGSDAVAVARLDGAELRNPRWSADGRLIAIQTSEPSIIVHDVRSGESRRLTSGTFGGWSPAKDALAYFTTNGDIAIVDVQSGASRTLVARPAGTDGFSDGQPYDPEPLAWSPDGRWIVASQQSGRSLDLLRIDAASGATGVLDTTTDFFRYRVDWSPDSSRVALAGNGEATTERLKVTGVDGTGTTDFVEPDGLVVDPDWSPDGAWIAYRSLAPSRDRAPALMIVRPDGSDARRLAVRAERIVGWSDDGASVAYSIDSDPDDDGGRELHLVTIDDGSDRVVSVPDGAGAFAWAKAVHDETGDVVAPSLPAPIASLIPEAAIAEPAAGEPVEPDAAWGGLAFRAPQDQEFDCRLAVLRFPDQLTVLEPQAQAAPPSASPAEPAGPIPSAVPANYCEFAFAPDRSVFMRWSQRDGTFEIVHPDGTLVSGPARSRGGMPTWSSAGSWIATRSCSEAGCPTTIMRPDGSDRRELIARTDCNEAGCPLNRIDSEDSVPRDLPAEPVWSAGDRVLAVPGLDGSLLVGNGDGTDLRAIGTFPPPTGWSADGSTFVFIRDGDAWLAEADGSGVRNLTEFPFGGAAGAWWSPDGRWIVVTQGFTVWVFSPDGSVRRRLGGGMEVSTSPAWSPLGTWLALEHDDRVTLFRVDDWSAVRLENATAPAWSRDGRHLAVVSQGEGGFEVDVMNPDGTGRVTVSSEIGYPPLTWLP
jgi:Tol biopolymer transport system component